MKKYPNRMTNDQGMEHLLHSLSCFQPMSYIEYSELSGITLSSSNNRFIKAKSMKLIHIDHFIRNSPGQPIPYYSIGFCPDAKRPTPLTTKEKSAAYRTSTKGRRNAKRSASRWRKSEHGKMLNKSSQQTRSTKRKLESGMLEKIDPLLAVLYGRKNVHDRV